MCCCVHSYFSANLSRLKKLLTDLPSVHSKREPNPRDTAAIAHFPSWNEVRFQTPAGHWRHGCEGMCFWWWCWYLFHVYVHSNHLQKENQSHSCLLMFSKTSYRKESLELSYKTSNLSPPTFFVHLESGYSQGQISSSLQILFSPSPLYHLVTRPIFATFS